MSVRPRRAALAVVTAAGAVGCRAAVLVMGPPAGPHVQATLVRVTSTWQVYNAPGGASTYSTAGRSVTGSYDRPLAPRALGPAPAR